MEAMQLPLTWDLRYSYTVLRARILLVLCALKKSTFSLAPRHTAPGATNWYALPAHLLEHIIAVAFDGPLGAATCLVPSHNGMTEGVNTWAVRISPLLYAKLDLPFHGLTRWLKADGRLIGAQETVMRHALTDMDCIANVTEYLFEGAPALTEAIKAGMMPGLDRYYEALESMRDFCIDQLQFAEDGVRMATRRHTKIQHKAIAETQRRRDLYPLGKVTFDPAFSLNRPPPMWLHHEPDPADVHRETFRFEGFLGAAAGYGESGAQLDRAIVVD